MVTDAKRFKWHWAVSYVSPIKEVYILDPKLAKIGREVRLGEEAIIENVPLWLDLLYAP